MELTWKRKPSQRRSKFKFQIYNALARRPLTLLGLTPRPCFPSSPPATPARPGYDSNSPFFPPYSVCPGLGINHAKRKVKNDVSSGKSFESFDYFYREGNWMEVCWIFVTRRKRKKRLWGILLKV